MKNSKTPPQKSLFSEIVPQPLLANKEKYLPLLGPSASGSCSDDQSRATTPAKPFATFSDVIGEVLHPKVRKSSCQVSILHNEFMFALAPWLSCNPIY